MFPLSIFHILLYSFVLATTYAFSQQWNPNAIVNKNLASSTSLQQPPSSSLTESVPASPVLSDFSLLDETLPAKSKSGLDKYVTEALSLMGKAPIFSLRTLIEKSKKESLPPMDADLETHVNAALDATWSLKNGDWDGLIVYLKTELDEVVDRANISLRESVEYGNKLTESKIKQLITIHSDLGVNAMPKLNKRKHTGKFGKVDYLAVLIDILRENNGNDYTKVAEILVKESQSQSKKGFGSSK